MLWEWTKTKLPKEILCTNPGDQQGRGRPKSRWIDGVEEDTGKLGCGNLRADAQNRGSWRHLFEEAKAHRGTVEPMMMMIIIIIIIIIEQNAPLYQGDCFITSPMEDGQEGDLQRGGGRAWQTTRLTNGKDADADDNDIFCFCVLIIPCEYFIYRSIHVKLLRHAGPISNLHEWRKKQKCVEK